MNTLEEEKFVQDDESKNIHITDFFSENRKIGAIFLLGQTWIFLLPKLSNLFIILPFVNSCGGSNLLFRGLIAIFCITHAFNIGYMIYLYSKKHLSKDSVRLIPFVNLVASGAIFFFTMLLPMC